MKRLVTLIIVILLFGYLIYKNGSLWALKLLSFGGSSNNTSSSLSYSGPVPPFKDGTYTGNAADAFYGTIQVQTVISGGKITDVVFLQYPNDRSRSIAINTFAMPNLKQEAITAQSAQVDIVSGATDSSNAFIQSLSSALSQAK
ncbi:MAG: FMN-binding protein [Candidatus Levyibacteriota bacterium]